VSFDEVVLPHLDAAYRLARWLMRNEHDAEDVVQEASLRAFRYFRTFAGGNGRAWFLRIVRNTCYGWPGRSFQALTDLFDEEQHRYILEKRRPTRYWCERGFPPWVAGAGAHRITFASL